jgi:hypothetical protein
MSCETTVKNDLIVQIIHLTACALLGGLRHTRPGTTRTLDHARVYDVAYLDSDHAILRAAMMWHNSTITEVLDYGCFLKHIQFGGSCRAHFS